MLLASSILWIANNSHCCDSLRFSQNKRHKGSNFEISVKILARETQAPTRKAQASWIQAEVQKYREQEGLLISLDMVKKLSHI